MNAVTLPTAALVVLLTLHNADVTRARSLGNLTSAVRETRSSGDRGGLQQEGDDQSVCYNLRTGSTVNQRSTCPWHHELIDTSAGTSPRTVVQAVLTCGSRCLMVNSTGHKTESNYPCLPINRSVTLRHCENGNTNLAPHRSRRCWSEVRMVPIAFTCAFMP